MPVTPNQFFSDDNGQIERQLHRRHNSYSDLFKVASDRYASTAREMQVARAQLIADRTIED
jgi:hypothetical protein